MRGAGGRDPSVAVRRRRGDPAAERLEQRLRDGMRRHAHRHRVLPARQFVRHAGCAWQHQGQRARPEACGERRGGGRHGGHPLRQRGGIGEVQDERVRSGPALERIDAPQRRGVARIRAEPVDGLGRESDQAARAQRADGRGDVGRAARDGGHVRQSIALHPGAPAARPASPPDTPAATLGHGIRPPAGKTWTRRPRPGFLCSPPSPVRRSSSPRRRRRDPPPRRRRPPRVRPCAPSTTGRCCRRAPASNRRTACCASASSSCCRG